MGGRGGGGNGRFNIKLWGNSSSGSNSAAEEGNENIPEAHGAGWEIESVAESRQDDSAAQARGLGGSRKELAHRRIALEQENNKRSEEPQIGFSRQADRAGPRRQAQDSVSCAEESQFSFHSLFGFHLISNTERQTNRKRSKRGKQSRCGRLRVPPPNLHRRPSNPSPVPGSEHPSHHTAGPPTCRLCTAQHSIVNISIRSYSNDLLQ